MEEYFRDGDAFLVHYGDIVTNQDVNAMLEAHRQKHALATLLLHQRENSNSVVVLNEENRVTAFLERPTAEERRGVESPWVNSGVFICHPSILDEIPPNVSCDFPRDVFTRLVETNRLFGFPLSGYRCAVDSPARLDEARMAVANGVLSL